MKRAALTIAFCLGLATSAPALAQPVSPSEGTTDESLTAQSAALTPEQRTQAQNLFATSFSLWQSGDFAAAEIGFQNGLAVDPANALANYYYGDCLARRKDRVKAKAFLERAVAFGKMTAEGLKAQAELAALETAATDPESMSASELQQAFVGTWVWDLGQCVPRTGLETKGQLEIRSENGRTAVIGVQHATLTSPWKISSGTISGTTIRYSSSAAFVGSMVFEGHLTSTNRFAAKYISPTGKTCDFEASKQ